METRLRMNLRKPPAFMRGESRGSLFSLYPSFEEEYTRSDLRIQEVYHD